MSNKDIYQLKAGHPIHTFISEHEEILKFLVELEDLNDRIQATVSLDDLAPEDINKLKHIAHHLEAAEKHHRREEEVLLPEMEKRGIVDPPEMMRKEHTEIRLYKKALQQIAVQKIKSFNKFKDDLDENVQFILTNLRNHIYKEDNILYPMALESITGEKTWDEIKKRCDEIGYCCFTPKG